MDNQQLEESANVVGFHEMGLDDRLLQAIARLRWRNPTLIQEKAIPLALEGKDLLARARTGSGKTAAFAVPCIHRILLSKQSVSSLHPAAVRVLVLAPTRELCRQLASTFHSLIVYCSRHVRCVNVGTEQPLHEQIPSLQNPPDILIGTPSRVLAHLQSDTIKFEQGLPMSGRVSAGDKGSLFQTLVLDEADLMLTFGHGDDVKSIMRFLPPVHQTLLLSATLSEHVKELRQLLLHNPVVLRLQEPDLPAGDQLVQYHIKIEENDKFLLLYTLFKLKLIHGKTIIFVNKVDRCYRVKLFLEQFGIPSCALNSEMPANSRSHIVGQFNEGVYDVIIASDERFLEMDKTAAQLKASQTSEAAENSTDAERSEEPSQCSDERISQLNRSRRQKDRESGVARGIDFQFVSNVINFDFPVDVDSYIHRAGRTARGNSRGSALSFVAASELPVLEAVEHRLAEMFPSEPRDQLFRPYHVKLEEMAGFRYRAQDAMRAVTRRAIREARLKEIKKELYNSRRLHAHFERNPRDLQLLRHDRALHTARVHKHMKHVPDYIVPKSLRRRAAVLEQKQLKQRKQMVAEKKYRQEDKRKRSARNSASANDPLKTLTFSGLDEFR